MTPTFETVTSNPDRLVAGEKPRPTEDIPILTGQNLVAGSVVGEQTVSTVPATGTADGGNTGDGTLGSVTGGAETQPGTYTIECVEVATNGGIFSVVAPDGNRVGSDAVVAVAYTSPHLNFTIADGSTDYDLGDKFTIAVTGSGKYVLSASADIDGSQRATHILADAVDASSGDKKGPAYMEGEFNENDLTFGTDHTADSVRADLLARGIILRDTVPR